MSTENTNESVVVQQYSAFRPKTKYAKVSKSGKLLEPLKEVAIQDTVHPQVNPEQVSPEDLCSDSEKEFLDTEDSDYPFSSSDDDSASSLSSHPSPTLPDSDITYKADRSDILNMSKTTSTNKPKTEKNQQHANDTKDKQKAKELSPSLRVPYRRTGSSTGHVTPAGPIVFQNNINNEKFSTETKTSFTPGEIYHNICAGSNDCCRNCTLMQSTTSLPTVTSMPSITLTDVEKRLYQLETKMEIVLRYVENFKEAQRLQAFMDSWRAEMHSIRASP